MAVTHHNSSTESVVTGAPTTYSTGFRRALAALRISYGVTFLWAFLDKAFALGFHTGAIVDPNTGARTGIDFFAQDQAWFNGGSPTEGFLAFGVPADNPFKSMFNGMAGDTWVNWLFMLGLLGIGIALLSGVAMRIATVAGALMYTLMYAASVPLENNPIVEDHFIGFLVMIVLGLGAAGTTWGLGHWWGNHEVVKNNPVLR